MSLPARIILEVAAALITAGGLFDLLNPRLPSNLQTMCGESLEAAKLVRELLRALGGCLIAIGLAVMLMVATPESPVRALTLILVLLLVLPAESINAMCMYRVGSPFYFPLAFASLTVLGVMLAWPHHPL